MATTHIIGTVYKSDGTPYVGVVRFIPDRRLRSGGDFTITGTTVETQTDANGAITVDLEPGRYAMVIDDDATRPSVILVQYSDTDVQLSDILIGAYVEGWTSPVSYHTELLGRDDTDQHPIGAITDLQSALDAKAAQADLDAHAADIDNPHQVTAAQAGADPAGTAASEVAAHEAKADPHPQYAEDVDLSNHASDTTLHLTQDERDALAQANSPSTTNPVATIDDISLIPVGLRHFFLTTDDPTGYKQIQLNPDTFETASYDFSSVTDGQYLMGWITPEGETPEKLLEGPHLLHIYAQKTAGTQSIQFYYELYERDSGGTETLINQSSVSVEVPSETSPIAATLYPDALRTIAAGSRLVIKLFAKVTGSGGAPSITIYQSDTQRGFYQEPIDQERLDDRYTTDTEFISHTTDTNNPHQVTAEQAGADPAGTAQSLIDIHESSNDVHAITAVTGLQADLLTRGKYWGELAVADLPTESDGVKPGDTAHVTDALTLDGTGGLFVYDKDNGWVDRYGVKAAASTLEFAKSALQAPHGVYNSAYILPLYLYSYSSTGVWLYHHLPFSAWEAISLTAMGTFKVNEAGDCIFTLVPTKVEQLYRHYSTKALYEIKFGIRGYDVFTIDPGADGQYVHFCFGFYYDSRKVYGLTVTLVYDSVNGWRTDVGYGLIDTVTKEITTTHINYLTPTATEGIRFPTTLRCWLAPMVDDRYSNAVVVEYKGTEYVIDTTSDPLNNYKSPSIYMTWSAVPNVISTSNCGVVAGVGKMTCLV